MVGQADSDAFESVRDRRAEWAARLVVGPKNVVGQTLRAPLEEVLREFDGKIRLVHKDFPVPTHKGALPAAEAARCAAAQGAFWPYHDLLYLSVPDFSRNDLVGYAARLSLDRERFATCLDTHQFRQDIETDVKEGRALKLRGTPTFLVNGQPLEGAQPIEAFRDAIRNALRKASAP